MIVKGNVPSGTAAVVVTVRTEEPAPPATTPGEKAPEAPLGGRPATEREASPVNPFNDPSVTVYCADPPATTVAEDGAAASVKSGGADTTSVTAA